MAGTRHNGQTLGLRGLPQLLRATGGYKTDLAKEIRGELYAAAKIVSADARLRFMRYDRRTAMGMVPQARASGRTSVKQRRSKVRPYPGRPDYGALQMRKALLPALYSKADDVERAVDRMLARLGGDWSGGPTS